MTIARLTESDCACVPYRADEDFVRCERCGYGCAREASAPSARPGPVRARPVRFVTLPDDAPSPAERNAARRISPALAPDAMQRDEELITIRRVLAELRPDQPDPYILPPDDDAPGAVMTVRISRAPWEVGDGPRGFGSSAIDPGSITETAADRASYRGVCARAAKVPPPHNGVLWWMRRRATLKKGVRGLYVDAGLALAPKKTQAAWGDSFVRRGEGANHHGKKLVVAAIEAWDATGKR